MVARTRGEVEAELARAVVKFEKDHLGRGPMDARAFLVNDMILLRLRSELNEADRKLAETSEGQALVRETRRKLFEISRPIFEEMVEQIVGCNLVSFHSDMSAKTGERVIVLTVDANLDTLYR
ncbi:MAG: DUF2294 domain-containing protein [Chloroflexota bacterium]